MGHPRLVEQGRAGNAPVRRYLGALTQLGLDYFQLGRWEDAARAGGRGSAAVRGPRLPLLRLVLPVHRGCRGRRAGRRETSAALTERMVRWGTPGASTPHGSTPATPRRCPLSAAATSRPRTTTPARSAPRARWPRTFRVALWGAMDLVEAALRTGRETEAANHAAAMRAPRWASCPPGWRCWYWPARR